MFKGFNFAKSHSVIVAGSMVVVMTVLGIFTGYHSYHFLLYTLPANAWLLAAFALGALDVGLLLWSLTLLMNARNLTEEQRSIGAVMIVVDFVGVAVTFLADSFLQSSENGLIGKLDGIWPFVALVVTSAIILGNVGAFLLFHFQSDNYKQRIEERREALAEAHQAREFKRMEDDIVREERARLLPEIARMRAQHRIAIERAQLTGGLPKPKAARIHLGPPTRQQPAQAMRFEVDTSFLSDQPGDIPVKKNGKKVD